MQIWNNCVGQSGRSIGMAEAINLDRDARAGVSALVCQAREISRLKPPRLIPLGLPARGGSAMYALRTRSRSDV